MKKSIKYNLFRKFTAITLSFAMLLSSIVFSPQKANAAETVYLTEAAAWVFSDLSDITNYKNTGNDGQFGQFHVKTTSDESDIRMTYMRWDLSKITYSEESTIKLRLNYRDGSDALTTVNVLEVEDNDWDQATVLYENKPDWNETPIASFDVQKSINAGSIVEIDVTDFIKGQKEAGKTKVSLALRTVTPNWTWHSFESDRYNQATGPRLVVETVEKDVAGPAYKSALVNDTFDKVTINFDENIFDNSGDIKSRILLSRDGINYSPLSGSDTVTVSGSDIVVHLSDELLGEQNRIKILGNSLKDSLGNVTASDIITEALSAKSNVTSPLSAYPTEAAAWVFSNLRDSSFTNTGNDGQYGQFYVKTTSDESDIRMIYMRWDISKLIYSKDSTIKLRFTHNAGIAGGNTTVNVLPVADNSWNQATILWENKPEFDATPIAAFQLVTDDIPSGGMATVYVDITDYIKAQKNAGASHVSFALKTADVSDVIWHSIRSDRAANPENTRPALIVETDIVGPRLAQSHVSGDFKTVTLDFDEALFDNTAGNLKESVLLATNGVDFNELAELDTVTINQSNTKQLIISLNSPLAGDENKFKISAAAVKDALNNPSSECITQVLLGQDDGSSPEYRGAYLSGKADVITVNFNKNIAWFDNSGTVAASDNILISVDDGAAYAALNAADVVTFDAKALKIKLNTTITSGTVKLKIAGNTIASLNGNNPIATEIITDSMATSPELETVQYIKVSDDTYVDAGGAIGNPDTTSNSPYYKNYGVQPIMYLREMPGESVIGAQKSRIFLKFDVRNLGTFNDALLSIYLMAASPIGGTVNFYAVEDDSWTETSLTYENQPAYGKLLASVNIDNGRTDTTYVVNITDYLSEERGKDGFASIMIMDDANSKNSARTFRSKDYTSADVYPMLKVEYDKQAPQVSGSTIKNLNKTAEIVFKEPIFNAAGDAAALKSLIQVSKDGGAFEALAAGDAVAMSNDTLTITFAQRLTCSSMQVKFLPNSLKDRFDNTIVQDLCTVVMVLDGTAPTLDADVYINPEGKAITIKGSEGLMNNKANTAELKAAVTFAADGMNFAALGDSDTVNISGSNLIITLNSAISGDSNKVKIAPNTIADLAGNPFAQEYISSPIVQDVMAPNLVAAYTVNFNKDIVLAFDEPVFNVLAGDEELKAAITVSTDGNTYVPLGADDKVYIGIKYLHILPSEPFTGNATFKINGNTIRDTLSNVAASDIVTQTVTAGDYKYPYAHPDEEFLQDALVQIQKISFLNLKSAQASASETQAAKGFAVVAQAIAAGNRNPQLVNAYISAVRDILTVPAKMPNLGSALDDRAHSPIVYGISLLWNEQDIMSQFTETEKSTLVTFMKAALIGQLYGFNEYQNGVYVGSGRRPSINGDANNGLSGNHGQPHMTSLLASAFALGLENIKQIIAEYDHMSFIQELKNQGLTTIAAAYEETQNFSAKATQAERLADKAAYVNTTLKDPRYQIWGYTLDKFIEDPLIFFGAYDAHLYPHEAQDGDYMGQPGMEMEFRTADAGGPRENAGYVILGMEPSVSNSVLLNRYGYFNAPQNKEKVDQLVKLQMVGVNDFYTKMVNGHFSQCWLGTETQDMNHFAWPFLFELFYSTGMINRAAFNDSFNYATVEDMWNNHWVANTEANLAISKEVIIPYNKKNFINTSVIGGTDSDPNEKVLVMGSAGQTAVAYNTRESFSNINYSAWISTPALGEGEAGILARVVDENNYYQVSYTKDTLFIKKKVDGAFTTIAEKAYTMPSKAKDFAFFRWPWGWFETIVDRDAYRLRVEFEGNQINVYVNGEKLLTATDNTFARGYAGIAAINTTAKFDALLLTRTSAEATTIEKITIGNQCLTVDIAPVSGATKYIIHYGTEPGNYTHHIETNSVSNKIEGLINETTYYFAVTYESLLGTSGYSNEMSQTPYEPDAVTPSDFDVSVDGLQATFNFTPESINTGYLIKYGKLGSGVYTNTIEDVQPGDTITLPESAKPHYFAIIPYNDRGMGTAKEVMAALDVNFLYIVNATANSVNVEAPRTIDDNLDPGSRWSAESILGGELIFIDYALEKATKMDTIQLAFHNGHVRKAYFSVDYSLDGETWTSALGDTTTSGTTNGLEAYTFPTTITAKYIRINCYGHDDGVGRAKGIGWNSIIEFRILKMEPLRPTEPTGLTADSKTTASVSLKWNASTSESGSAISYDVYKDGVKANSEDITETAYTVTGLMPDTSYTFTVVAKDAEGNESTASNSLTVTTDAETPVVTPPTQPTGLTADSKTTTSVSLKWNASTTTSGSAISYDVYKDGVKENTADITETAYTVTGLTPDTEYNFTVVAKDAEGNESAASNPLTVTTDAETPIVTPPTQPSGLDAEAKTTNSVSLKWDASTTTSGSAISYDVYKDGVKVNTEDITETAYTVTGLTPDTEYNFTVVAKDAEGNESAASNPLAVTTEAEVPVVTPPDQPTGLSADSKTKDSINLKWNASTSESGSAISYDVYKDGVKVNTEDITETAYTVTGLTPGTEYSFTVVAKDAEGNESAASNPLAVTTEAETPVVTPPTQPSGLEAEAKTTNSVSLKWNASTSESGSAISYDVYKDGVKANTEDITETAYTVTGLTPGTEYSFTVVAKDAEGNESVASSAITVKTDAETPVVVPPAPPAPTPTPEPVTDKIEIKAEVNGETARAKVELETLNKAFEAASKDEKGDKVVTLEIEATGDATEYLLELPKEIFNAAGKKDGEKKLEIKTAVGTVTVSDNLFKTKDLHNASKVEISIASADAESHPVIALNALVDGKVIDWKNNNAPVTVSLNYAPTAEELKNSEHIVVVYIDGDGKEHKVPNGKYNAATETVTFTTTHAGQYAVAFVVKTFEDITDIAWAKREIEVLASKGVISGTSETTYTPNANITRADFIKLLIGALGISAEIDSNFDDVKPADYYYEAVGIAKALGITAGVGNNKLDPKGYITRQDMMVLIAKAMKITNKELSTNIPVDLTSFKDSANIASYAKEAIIALISDGMVVGNGDTLNPAGNTTRAQAAVLLYKLYNK